MFFTIFLVTGLLGYITYKLTSSIKFAVFVFLTPLIVAVMLVTGYILAAITS